MALREEATRIFGSAIAITDADHLRGLNSAIQAFSGNRIRHGYQLLARCQSHKVRTGLDANLQPVGRAVPDSGTEVNGHSKRAIGDQDAIGRHRLGHYCAAGGVGIERELQIIRPTGQGAVVLQLALVSKGRALGKDAAGAEWRLKMASSANTAGRFGMRFFISFN